MKSRAKNRKSARKSTNVDKSPPLEHKDLVTLQMVMLAMFPVKLPLPYFETSSPEHRRILDEHIDRMLDLPKEVIKHDLQRFGEIDQEVVDIIVFRLLEIVDTDSLPRSERARDVIEALSTPAARVLLAVARASDTSPRRRQIAVEIIRKVAPGWLEPNHIRSQFGAGRSAVA